MQRRPKTGQRNFEPIDCRGESLSGSDSESKRSQVVFRGNSNSPILAMRNQVNYFVKLLLNFLRTWRFSQGKRKVFLFAKLLLQSFFHSVCANDKGKKIGASLSLIRLAHLLLPLIGTPGYQREGRSEERVSLKASRGAVGTWKLS